MIKPRNSHVKNASLLKRVLREDLKDANDATCLIWTVFHGLGALTAKARSPLITSQDVGNKPAHQGTSRLRWAPSIFFPFLGNTLSLTSSWVNLGALVSHGPVPDRFWSSRFFFFLPQRKMHENDTICLVVQPSQMPRLILQWWKLSLLGFFMYDSEVVILLVRGWHRTCSCVHRGCLDCVI